MTPCPWSRVPGVVRFMVFVENPIDVLDEGLADDVCVGEVSVPVASLVSDPMHGGAQRERKQWFSLQVSGLPKINFRIESDVA